MAGDSIYKQISRTATTTQQNDRASTSNRKRILFKTTTSVFNKNTKTEIIKNFNRFGAAKCKYSETQVNAIEAQLQGENI